MSSTDSERHLYLQLEDELDPQEALMKVINRASGEQDSALYQLYSSTIESKVGTNKEAFQRAISVIIAVSNYRPLGDEAIATLAGLKITVVQTLVDSLNALLYRDHSEREAIRVRHLSIIDFLMDPNSPPEFQVNIERANEEVGLACLSTMIDGLRFNICGLKTSLASNDDVKDLTERVEKNISDALQYSCIHWADHVCSIQYPGGGNVVERMKKLFESARPVYWIEVLSVMGKVPIGIRALRKVTLWAKNSNEPFVSCVKDTLRFLLTFHTPITTSAPHIYSSALAFIPKNCEFWKDASRLFKKVMNVEKGRMETWPTRPVAWLGHKETVYCIAYAPDGIYIVSGSKDFTLRRWDAETGYTIGEPWYGHTSTINCVAYSPDARYIVSGSCDKTLRLWDAEAGRAIGESWSGHTDSIRGVAYSPDARYVISGSEDKTLRKWDAETGGPIGEPWHGHTDSVYSVAYSPDGRYVVSGSEDKTLRMWDAETGRAIGEPWQGHTSSIYSVAYSPDGRYVVSGSQDKRLRMWDVDTGHAIGEPWRGHTRWVCNVAYSPDGCHIVSGSMDNTLRRWDVETGQTIGEPWYGHTSKINCVAYSPDGRYVVSGSQDETLRMWDAETGRVIGEPSQEHTVSETEDKTIQVGDSSLPRAISKDFVPNADGWVIHSDGGLLFWVPEDCRRGLAGFSIPTNSPDRAVRLDPTDFRYGTSWTEIYEAGE